MQIIYLVLPLLGLAVLFLVFRPKMDPRVKKLAEVAYVIAAELNNLKVRGSAPSVVLQKKPKGTVTGKYRWWPPFSKWVIYDNIWVLDKESSILYLLVHEMIHAIRRRHGLPQDEALARKIARGVVITPSIQTLINEMYK